MMQCHGETHRRKQVSQTSGSILGKCSISSMQGKGRPPMKYQISCEPISQLSTLRNVQESCRQDTVSARKLKRALGRLTAFWLLIVAICRVSFMYECSVAIGFLLSVVWGTTYDCAQDLTWLCAQGSLVARLRGPCECWGLNLIGWLHMTSALATLPKFHSSACMWLFH